MEHSGNVSSLVEPYEHVNFPISPIDPDSMRDFVAWDLEKEHGDLGLGSSNSRKPPLSFLGASLREDGPGGTARNLVERIVGKAHGNIAIAKIRLDLVHREQTCEAAVRDRLPSNLLALFDAGMKQIEEQPAAQRELALNAISAVCKEYDPMDFGLLEKRLLQATSRSGSGKNLPQTKDVLQAAKGFLVFSHTENTVAVYNTDFHSYITEDYNESLFWAHAQLPLGRIARSSSFNDTLDPKSTDDESFDEHGSLLERSAGAFRSAKRTRADSFERSTIFPLSRTSTDSFPSISRRSTDQWLSGRGNK